MSRIVELALRQRLLVVGIFVAMLIAGGVGFWKLNIEAYPDPVPPMVEIITQTRGLSAEEMERNVTTPVEVAIAGLPNLTAVRSISLFGLSDVRIQFSYAVSFREAEQLVQTSQALLVAGSSLVVNSGIRLVERARRRRLPVVIVNRGATRADGRATVKIDAGTSEVLTALARALPAQTDGG